MTDLTAITTPFGLLDRETQEALKAHGGPYQVWDPTYVHQWFIITDEPSWVERLVYRVKPAPPKPREWWAHPQGGVMLQPDNRPSRPDDGWVRVREVLE